VVNSELLTVNGNMSLRANEMSVAIQPPVIASESLIFVAIQFIIKICL